MNRDAIVAGLKSQLDQWNAQLATMESRAQATNSALREIYAKELTDLKRRRDEATTRLQSFVTGSEGAVQELRRGVEAAWFELGAAFSRAWQRVGEKPEPQEQPEGPGTS